MCFGAVKAHGTERRKPSAFSFQPSALGWQFNHQPSLAALEQLAELRHPWKNTLNESILPSVPQIHSPPLVRGPALLGHKDDKKGTLFMTNALILLSWLTAAGCPLTAPL